MENWSLAKRTPPQRGAGRKGGRRVLVEFFKKLFKIEEKNCIVKQYHITLCGFTTQLEAWRIAEKICKEMQIDEGNVFIKEVSLENSQAEYDKILDKGQVLKNKYQQ